MSYFVRKNFSGGVLDQPITNSPGYEDDPLYDEIALTDGHNLPGEADASLTDQFRLVIWSVATDPGSDPVMEIVTATRTTHPRVYQIVQRGEEGTAVTAHPVGSYVGLHYTAGVSLNDLEYILAIVTAPLGSLFYTWHDNEFNRIIEVLVPGTYGMVLVTAGDNHRPFWDWVWESPGGAGGMIAVRYIELDSYWNLVKILMNHSTDEVADSTVTEFGTDLGPNPEWFFNVDMEGDIGSGEDFGSSISYEFLIFDGSSESEPIVDVNLSGDLVMDVVTALT